MNKQNDNRPEEPRQHDVPHNGTVAPDSTAFSITIIQQADGGMRVETEGVASYGQTFRLLAEALCNVQAEITAQRVLILQAEQEARRSRIVKPGEWA